ncbi:MULTISPECIES: DUF1236 domain-containing protein [unclassified Bradyrhizobium]|uniref:DUF1236 domain-containing protein n=1 Tax=unclassified Bradyrhizobium TaxID=2631580 RepID=UPI001FF82E3E|nr:MULTISPECIES: DUF1236 domain-containing protein [unclassified Bradyrhizobium]MCK1715751.1 DUF1236 domain-containing protein [Bradyrhizobium sp. 143]MCK1730559.1 DUF1236 domain-containing protein [Bradyrhizobium sp. 142]
MIRLLATTALGVVIANAAFAQSPPNPRNPAVDQPTQAQTNPTAQPNTASPGTGQSAPQAQKQPSSGTSAQTNTGAQPSAGTGTSSSAQQTTNPPASQQSTNPPANTNQAQQAPGASGTNQSQQAPNAPVTEQAQQAPPSGGSSPTAARTDVNINKQQETRISQSISRLNVRPVTNVNFSLSVGTVVPRDIQLATLPPDVVEIVPQYRGLSFALVKDEIVVVDPANYKIVTVLPYSGQSTATTTTRERSSSKFSDRDREVVRKHAKTRAEGRTTGSTARSEIRTGERVPETVEIEEFPSEVYREAPALREYRYIHRDNRTFMIEPRERTVIEEID